MKNQDPLKPETNGDLLAQLAQFKTSYGIAEMQKTLDSLTSSMQYNQALQASALVGRTVLVQASQGSLNSEGVLNGVATLPASAQNVTMDVCDSVGSLVKTVLLGVKPGGDLEFSWDGTNQANQRVQQGIYRIAIKGSIGKESMQFPTHIAANVDSLILCKNGEEMKLNVESVGLMKLNEIKQISE